MKPTVILAVAFALSPLGAARADSWPQFRGPGGLSLAEPTPLPTAWSVESGQNIAWEADLPGKGVSGPIVVDGLVIVTASSGPKEDRLHVLAFDAATGAPRWRRQFWATGRTNCYRTSAVAASTPATDGESVFALYSSNDLACFDLDGNMRWMKSLTADHPGLGNDIGMASSPVAVAGAVVVQCESQPAAFAAAFEADTGALRWEKPRKKQSCWTSPIAVGNNVLLQSRGGVALHDGASGEVVWRQEFECAAIASPTLYADELIASAGGLTALRIEDGVLSWRQDSVQGGSPSPVATGGAVLVVKRGGVLASVPLGGGPTNWQKRLGGSFWATPVVVGDRAYCFNEAGDAVVVDLANRGAVLGKSKMGQAIYASPAVAEGGLFVRSHGKLWKIAIAETARGGDDRRL